MININYPDQHLNVPVFNQQPESFQYSLGEDPLVKTSKPCFQMLKHTHYFYWYKRYKIFLLLQQFHQGWRTEVLVQTARNNTQIVISRARKIDPIVRLPIIDLNVYKQLKVKRVTPLLMAFQTGRLGFIKNQKKTFTAADTAVKCILWIVRKYHKMIKPVLIRFRSRSLLTIRHHREFQRHFERLNTNDLIYGVEESVPVQTGFFRILRTPRKRLTYRPQKKVTLPARTLTEI